MPQAFPMSVPWTNVSKILAIDQQAIWREILDEAPIPLLHQGPGARVAVHRQWVMVFLGFDIGRR